MAQYECKFCKANGVPNVIITSEKIGEDPSVPGKGIWSKPKNLDGTEHKQHQGKKQEPQKNSSFFRSDEYWKTRDDEYKVWRTNDEKFKNDLLGKLDTIISLLSKDQGGYPE